MEGGGQRILIPDGPGRLGQAGKQQSHDGQLLVKGCLPQFQHGDILPLAPHDVVHMVGPLVLVIEFQVVGKILGDAGQLDILSHHLPVHPEAQLFISDDEFGQVLPATGSGKLQAVHGGLDAVEVVLLDVQIRDDSAVDALSPGVFLPDGEVLCHVHALHTVQRHHVEVPDGLVVLRRVARRHDEPSLRQVLVAEGLALQKLQHHGGQRLADAVDLVQEQNALGQARPLHHLVHGGQNLAHGVLRNGVFLAAVGPLFDERQADGALAGVVGDGVGHQAHALLRRDLLHDLGLADARRAHQQHGPLPDRGDQVIPQGVLFEIRLQRVGDLLLCLFDVHSV